MKEFSTDYKVVAVDMRGFNESEKPLVGLAVLRVIGTGEGSGMRLVRWSVLIAPSAGQGILCHESSAGRCRGSDQGLWLHPVCLSVPCRLPLCLNPSLGWVD